MFNYIVTGSLYGLVIIMDTITNCTKILNTHTWDI